MRGKRSLSCDDVPWRLCRTIGLNREKKKGNIRGKAASAATPGGLLFNKRGKRGAIGGANSNQGVSLEKQKRGKKDLSNNTREETEANGRTLARIQQESRGEDCKEAGCWGGLISIRFLPGGENHPVKKKARTVYNIVSPGDRVTRIRERETISKTLGERTGTV